MKLNRRNEEPTSIAFLSVITCGFGAIILLLIIAKSEPPVRGEIQDDPRVGQINLLQLELFKVQSALEKQIRQASAQEKKLNRLKGENSKIEKELIELAALLSRNRLEKESLSF